MANFLLLHGALGSTLDLRHIELALQERRHTTQVIQLDPEITEAIPQMAVRLESVLLGYSTPVHVIGYSMGGYVALFLAARRPNLFASLTTLAVKLKWSKEGVAHEKLWMIADKIAENFPVLYQSLLNTHGAGWTRVVKNTINMMEEIATHQYIHDEFAKTIQVSTTMLVGDLDKMVSVAETQHLAALIPNGVFKALPGVKHPVQSWKGQGLVWLETN